MDNRHGDKVAEAPEGSERSAGIDAAWKDGHEIVECDTARIEWKTGGRCSWGI